MKSRRIGTRILPAHLRKPAANDDSRLNSSAIPVGFSANPRGETTVPAAISIRRLLKARSPAGPAALLRQF